MVRQNKAFCARWVVSMRVWYGRIRHLVPAGSSRSAFDKANYRFSCAPRCLRVRLMRQNKAFSLRRAFSGRVWYGKTTLILCVGQPRGSFSTAKQSYSRRRRVSERVSYGKIKDILVCRGVGARSIFSGKFSASKKFRLADQNNSPEGSFRPTCV